jgi:fumarylacetoacetate (FAA) hydrolase
VKLGSLKEGGRDGTLIVVSRDLTEGGAKASGIAPTLQRALEDWQHHRAAPECAVRSR